MTVNVYQLFIKEEVIYVTLTVNVVLSASNEMIIDSMLHWLSILLFRDVPVEIDDYIKSITGQLVSLVISSAKSVY